jgi:hypothetical protein
VSSLLGLMDRRWKFDINEITVSAYHCRAIRSGDRILTREGGDEAERFLLYDVFSIELAYRTSSDEAAFHLVSGYLPELETNRR